MRKCSNSGALIGLAFPSIAAQEENNCRIGSSSNCLRTISGEESLASSGALISEFTPAAAEDRFVVFLAAPPATL